MVKCEACLKTVAHVCAFTDMCDECLKEEARIFSLQWETETDDREIVEPDGDYDGRYMGTW